MPGRLDVEQPIAPVRRAPLDRLDVAVVAAALVLLLLLGFVVWPVLSVLAASVGGPSGAVLGSWAELLGSGRLLRLLLHSLGLSAVSTVLTVAVALVPAYAVTRTDIPGKRFVSIMSLLPLISPPFLVSLALLLLLGRRGIVTRGLGLDWSIDGFTGIVVAQVVTFLPQAYILLATALGTIDASLEEVAESLGAGPLTTLRRVTLALVRPGLASAALVVFLLCLADFGNPLLIGGRYDVLTTEIWAQATGRGDVAAGAAMSVALLVPCLAAWLLSVRWTGAKSYGIVSAGARTAVRATPRALRWSLFVLSGGVALLVAVLFVLIPLGSVVQLWGSDWSPSLGHWAVASSPEGARPIWNSLRLALASGVGGTALALVTAYLIERARPRAWRAIAALALLPAALPGTVVGLGYALAFNGAPPFLPGTAWVLLASVVVWALPVAALAGIDALRRIDPAVLEAAASLGAGSVTTFARVVAPLLAGAASSIFAYFFVNGLITVSAVIFLVAPGSDLGSVAILRQVQHGELGAACALGTMLLALAVGSVLLLRALLGGDRLAVLKL